MLGSYIVSGICISVADKEGLWQPLDLLDFSGKLALVGYMSVTRPSPP